MGEAGKAKPNRRKVEFVIRKCKQLLAKMAFARAGKPVRPATDFKHLHRSPVSHSAAYWVGHSLMQETVAIEQGEMNLFSLMKAFTQARDLGYQMFDHTLYGSPLSLQWRGCPHSYHRLAPEMQAKREQFSQQAAQYDTFVLTEVVPVRNVIQLEYSAYYLQQFYDTIYKANPCARVYVYESWDYLHGGISPANPRSYDWLSGMNEQRLLWENIADAASLGASVSPSVMEQINIILFGRHSKTDRKPIYLVPVGQVFLAIYKRMQSEGNAFVLADGSVLTFLDLFTNAYVNWPQTDLRLKFPDKPMDDIHPSFIGIYVVALVHFATLYGQSPIGLEAPNEIGDSLAEKFQSLVWDVVINDPRSGVKVNA